MRKNYRLASIALFLATLGVGCSEPAPDLETWPVTGAVIDQNGVSLASGVVRLHPKSMDADSRLIMAGPIRADGSFEVKTQRQQHTYDGAVTGEYRVVVISDKTLPGGQKSPIQYEIPATYSVKTEANRFDLRVER